MTIPWHHRRRFKGGLAHVAHEQRPDVRQGSTATGFKHDIIIPSLPASAWLCQDVQSLTLTWMPGRQMRKNWKVIPYSVCLPGDGMKFLGLPFYSVIVPTSPALRGITNTQTCPRAMFHSLIDHFSVAFLSPAYFSKCQARNSVSHLRLKIFSPFVKRVIKSLFVKLRESFLFNSTMFSLSLKLLEWTL